MLKLSTKITKYYKVLYDYPMEINTSILEINGSHYVRVPPDFVKYFRLYGKKTAEIKDVGTNKAEITFPVW